MSATKFCNSLSIYIARDKKDKTRGWKKLKRWKEIERGTRERELKETWGGWECGNIKENRWESGKERDETWDRALLKKKCFKKPLQKSFLQLNINSLIRHLIAIIQLQA